MRLYGRSIQLIIGNDKESLVITELKIDFEITKTVTQDPNKASVIVTNLNEQNRNLITSGKYNRIALKVGYGDDLRTLFYGRIDIAENVKIGVDIQTKLTCNDGQDDYRNAIMSVSLAKGATDRDILNHATASMIDATKGSQTLVNERRLPRGKVLHGLTRNVLSSIAKNHDADWSIQDGQLVVLPKSYALANNEGFLISESTGMIGSPHKTNGGLEVMCFLNNMMRIGQLCRVLSVLSEYNGDYKIVKIFSKGTNRGSDFTHVLTLQNGKFTEVKK